MTMHKIITIPLLLLILVALPGCLFLYGLGQQAAELTLSEARALVNNDMRQACSSLTEDDIVSRLLDWQYVLEGALPKYELLKSRLDVCEEEAPLTEDELPDSPSCGASSNGFADCMKDCAVCNALIIREVYPPTERYDVNVACYYLTSGEIDTLIALYDDNLAEGLTISEQIEGAVEACQEEPGDTGDPSICTACRTAVIETLYP